MTQCFKELAGSPEEHWGPSGFTATRHVVVPWANREAMALEVVGDGYEFGTTGAITYPSTEAVKGVRVASKPFVASPDKQGVFDEIATELNAYKLAELTIEYETIPAPNISFPGIDPDTFLTYSMDFGGDVMTLPKQALKWESAPNSPVPEEVKAVIRLPVIEHHLSWTRVLAPPWNAIRDLIGKVNKLSFIGLEPEQLLFNGCKANKEFIVLDELQEPQYGWKLDYTFRQRTIHGAIEGGPLVGGWNHFFNGLLAKWDRLLPVLYQSGDLATLFGQETEDPFDEP